MPDHELSILVVDDARFSSEFITRTLESAGYQNVLSTRSATEALTMMEQRPVSVLLADWLMPEMDGLELCDRVRKIDETARHFTYMVLFTGKDSPEAMAEAFDRGVDDFINKNLVRTELLPRIFAAERLAKRQNELLRLNAELSDRHRDIEARNIVDPDTGIGNLRYANLRLSDALRQCEGRGGQACLMLMGIRNHADIRQRCGENITREVVVEIGRRLAHLVRPLDILARVADDRFAVVAYMEREGEESAASLRRVHDAMNHKEFKTGAGFVDVNAGSFLVIVNQKNARVSPEQVIGYAESGLDRSYRSGRLEIDRWSSVRDSGEAYDG